ncbi:T9SS type A sorting domain-containing protein [Hymenobacter sp. 15J16-1T3B]|uniref:T9SS type A sorting domain-containing protein n=1 Tax=Hymenobacter sp. 15J16-1T3B TaxID=2886941 RepID=UPI001D124DF2|nr:T9SS type A sorting domain-containing protein [Hymenobacter sp. 15J16-1T3B]MCC3157392.1 T9SS type A sorting domain-containing protein [Hymenobacter sp. 15J16-1T3B]
MLPSSALRILLSALCALLLRTAAAQPSWQQLYSGPRPQSCIKALRQPDGGFLLVGEELLKQASSSQPAPRRLLLVRTDARGRQLWEQRLDVPGFPHIFVRAASQNGRGDLLLGLVNSPLATDFGSPNLLVALTPRGPIRWTRDFSGSSRRIVDLAPDDSHQGFVVALSDRGMAASLLYLQADGTQRQLLPLDFGMPVVRSVINTLLPQPGGVLVGASGYTSLSATSAVAKVIFVSDDGVRGAETVLPGSYIGPTKLLALGGNDFLAYDGHLHRLSLGVSGVQWSRDLFTPDGNVLSPEQWAASPSGEVLLSGFTVRNSHIITHYLALLNPNGTIQQLEASNQPAVTNLDATGRGSVASVLPGDAPGSFFLAGDVTEGLFLRLGSFAELELGAPTALAAWPNPVTDDELLTVTNSYATTHPLYLYDLSGHQVACWPAVAGGTAQLSLRGLRPGAYLLVGTNGQGKTGRMHLFKR